ncbi:MAG: ABC transporter substrate-binding protein, partial [Oscillospiraceae bacterium]|nr:ABC transporter substrate-binding protein [Oscillospiraceae bacterium]
MKNRILSLLLASVLLLSLTACGGSENKETPETRRANNELAIGLVQDLDDSLDPHKSESAATRELLFNVYEGLVKPDADGNFVGAVADDWSLSDDRCTYTFHLREGVKFCDGTPVTAEDVLASLERCRDDAYVPALAAASFSAEGENVYITIDKPNGEFLTCLTLAIAPKDKLGVLDTETWGTGPYRMTSRLVQNNIVFERNEHYWGTPGKVNKVTFRIVESAEAVVMALKSGAIDLSNHLTSTQTSQLGDFQILEGTMNLVQAVYLNHAVEPLNNELVRKALCHALDREQVFAMVADGHGTALGSSIYPNFRKYFRPELAELYPHDVEKAKALLKEAGYENGFPLTITVSSEHQPHMDAAQIIAEQFR